MAITRLKLSALETRNCSLRSAGVVRRRPIRSVANLKIVMHCFGHGEGGPVDQQSRELGDGVVPLFVGQKLLPHKEHGDAAAIRIPIATRERLRAKNERVSEESACAGTRRPFPCFTMS
jgi:hypothetical protein